MRNKCYFITLIIHSTLLFFLLGRISVQAAAPQDALVVQGKSYRMLFDRETGGLCGVYSELTHQWLVEEGAPRGVFALSLKEPGLGKEVVKRRIVNAALDSQTLTETSARQQILRQRYALSGGEGMVDVEISIDASKPYCVWSLQIENRTGLDIYEVEFPIVSKVSPLPGGELMLRGGAYHIQESPFQLGSLRDAFPSRIPFPILDIYAAEGGGGLFLIDQDTSLQRTEICVAKEDRRMFLSKSIRVANGTDCKIPGKVLFGVHTGDWHYAANLYRDFLTANFPQPKAPEWLEAF